MFPVLWSWSHLFLQDSRVCHHKLCLLLYMPSSQGSPTHQGNSLGSYYLRYTEARLINLSDVKRICFSLLFTIENEEPLGFGFAG